LLEKFTILQKANYKLYVKIVNFIIVKKYYKISIKIYEMRKNNGRK